MNFDELSNTVFRFPIRPIGAELSGGFFGPPPVGRVSFRDPVGRGLSLVMSWCWKVINGNTCCGDGVTDLSPFEVGVTVLQGVPTLMQHLSVTQTSLERSQNQIYFSLTGSRALPNVQWSMLSCGGPQLLLRKVRHVANSWEVPNAWKSRFMQPMEIAINNENDERRNDPGSGRQEPGHHRPHHQHRIPCNSKSQTLENFACRGEGLILTGSRKSPRSG